MNVLETVYYGNTLSAWLAAIAIAVAIVLGLQLLKTLLVERLGKTAASTRIVIDDIVVELMKRLRVFFFVIVSIYLTSLLLDIPVRAAHLIYLVMVTAVLAQLAILGNATIDIWVARHTAKHLANGSEGTTTIAALGYFGRLILWGMILMLALDNMGVNITALIAGLGVTGIAVALAVQNILGDLFASLSIMLDKPFAIGDFIVVDDFMGKVEHIGLKTTRLRSVFGEQIIFSNADLLKSRIRNLKRMRERRVVFNLSLTYENSYDNLRRIPALLKDIIDAQPHTRFASAHLKELRDFALLYEVAYFVDRGDHSVYLDTQQEINLTLFQRFHTEGIEFAHQATAHTQRLPQSAAAKDAHP